MIINVKNIEKNINDLNKLVAIYENNLLNYHNIFSEINKFWIGDKAIRFFDKTNIEQQKINNNIHELKSLISIYQYIVNEYRNIGNNIIIDLRKKDLVNANFDEIIGNIRKIISLYNNIPAVYTNLIYNQKKYFIDLVEIFEYLKKRYNAILDEIYIIESNVKVKISKINIVLIKESDIRNLL